MRDSPGKNDSVGSQETLADGLALSGAQGPAKSLFNEAYGSGNVRGLECNGSVATTLTIAHTSSMWIVRR